MDAVNPFSARMFSIPDSSNAVSLMCNVLRFVRFLRLENLAPQSRVRSRSKNSRLWRLAK